MTNDSISKQVGYSNCDQYVMRYMIRYNSLTWIDKKAVLPQGNRAMLQVFFSVEVRQQHSLQV